MIDKIIEGVKIFLLIFPPIMGYWFVYAMAWMVLGLPLERWSAVTLLGLAGLSEAVFLKWVVRWEKDELCEG